MRLLSTVFITTGCVVLAYDKPFFVGLAAAFLINAGVFLFGER